MGSRLRENNGGGGTGMGPRMREDNGWGWILACVFTGAGSSRGVRGWVPACARTMGGDGFLPASSRGQALCGGYGDGSPHARGQWVGMDSCLRLHGGGLFAGMMGVSWEGGWVPAFARTTEAGVRGWVPAYARTTVGARDEGNGRAVPERPLQE